MTSRSPLKKRWLVVLACLPFVMFGFAFALVPLYNTMCKALGINGKTSARQYETSQQAQVDTSRWVTVEFMASNNSTLPWQFKPSVKQVRLHPGEMKRLSYFAQNDSNDLMFVQAIPSVSPGIAAKYIKKTECFCFTQQHLAAHESRDMPLLFHLDPDLPRSVKTLTLSYTLFDVTDRVRPG